MKMGEYQPIVWPICPKNCMKIKEIVLRGGAHLWCPYWSRHCGAHLWMKRVIPTSLWNNITTKDTVRSVCLSVCQHFALICSRRYNELMKWAWTSGLKTFTFTCISCLPFSLLTCWPVSRLMAQIKVWSSILGRTWSTDKDSDTDKEINVSSDELLQLRGVLVIITGDVLILIRYEPPVAYLGW